MDRESFLSSIVKTKVVPVALTIGTVYVRSMDGGIRDRFEAMVTVEPKTAKVISDARWFAISNCLCDETGELLLTGKDREQFGTWNSADRELIFEAVLNASKVSDSDREFLEKN